LALESPEPILPPKDKEGERHEIRKPRRDLQQPLQKEELKQSDVRDIWSLEEISERARLLRRKKRLGALTPEEEADLVRLHSILDAPTEEEMAELKALAEVEAEEFRDQHRFETLLDEFEKILEAMRQKSHGG
jgi:hypothetical protein